MGSAVLKSLKHGFVSGIVLGSMVVVLALTIDPFEAFSTDWVHTLAYGAMAMAVGFIAGGVIFLLITALAGLVLQKRQASRMAFVGVLGGLLSAVATAYLAFVADKPQGVYSIYLEDFSLVLAVNYTVGTLVVTVLCISYFLIIGCIGIVRR